MCLTEPQISRVKLPKVMVVFPVGLVVLVGMVIQALLSGAVQAVAAGLPDGVSAAVVFVVGGDVADRLMQTN